MTRLEGKVCVVTGTGGSIGRATAQTFAREGAMLVGCDAAVEPAEQTVDLVRAAGGQMVSLQPCRLSDPADCAKLVALAVSAFGRIDRAVQPRSRRVLQPPGGHQRRGVGQRAPE